MIKSGRVVRVFDDEKIAINLGSEEGIQRSRPVRIYAEAVEIEDPETSEILGVYRHLKAVGRTSRVSERFSIVVPVPKRERVIESNHPASMLMPRVSSVKTVPGAFPVGEFDTKPIPSGDNIQAGDEVEVDLDES